MNEVKKIVKSITGGEGISAFDHVYRVDKESKIRRWFIGIFIAMVIFLFLPWTQNIRARGSVTTLKQEQRLQEVNSIIPGRIVKWYVKEGDFVRAGDTIVQLAEIKDDYLNPELIQRTREQLEAKGNAISSYERKAEALKAQINTLQQNLEIKLSQLRLKVVSDSIEANAAQNALQIAEQQYARQLIMRDSGLVSKVQLEQRNQKLQDAIAKRTSTQIKFTNSKIELSQIRQEYAEKIFKARGDLATAESEIAKNQGEYAKISNQLSNYNIRAGQYFITAPQEGQIIKANRSGINEIIKDGDKLVEIVPVNIQHAVEIYVRPVDLPLLSIGREVRFLFDGYPAIVFSGWPQASYGVFNGVVSAIEGSVSTNGKFRVLVVEERGKKAWPPGLTLGTGASAIILLKDVPIWYELWRNINGFPPEYYQQGKKDIDAIKKVKI